jgi:hypothetical protein
LLDFSRVGIVSHQVLGALLAGRFRVDFQHFLDQFFSFLAIHGHGEFLIKLAVAAGL